MDSSTEDKEWKTKNTRVKKFKSILLENSQSEDYAEAVNEWRYYVRKAGEVGCDKCICGTPIVYQHAIANAKTDKVLTVGSECIKKIRNKEIRDGMKLQLKIDKGNIKDKRICIVCCDYRVGNKEPTYNICKSCYAEGEREPSKTYLSLFGDECVRCDAKFIPKFEGADLCLKCYKDKQKLAKECPRCGEKNILPGQENKKMCTKCSTSSDCMRVCKGCKKKAIYGNSPDYVSLCSKCGDDTICGSCEKKFNAKWPGCKTCPDCARDEKEYYRECFTCGQKKIPPTEGDDVSVCKACANTDGKRECIDCGKKAIYGNKPAFIKKCDDCNAKGKKDRPCPKKGCKNIIIAKDHWKKECSACYLAANKK